jgi:hypothetical protein
VRSLLTPATAEKFSPFGDIRRPPLLGGIFGRVKCAVGQRWPACIQNLCVLGRESGSASRSDGGWDEP